MERNKELLEKTMQAIKDHPEQHHQGWWGVRGEANAAGGGEPSCGTAMCFAGWGMFLEGYQMVFSSETANRTSIARKIVGEGKGEIVEVPIKAREIFGLTINECDTLFAPTNTQEELELMVKDLVNGDNIRARYQYQRQLREADLEEADED